jgi:hypothetical protein
MSPELQSPPPSLPPPPEPIMPPPPLVALVGWLIPGAGYWLIGQRARAITVGVTIVALFVLGLLIGGIRVVEAPTGASPQKILQKAWFIPQALTGPIAVATHMAAEKWVPEKVVSTARVNEIGTLYTAVAGLLNLMVVMDAALRAGNRGER